MSTHATAIQPAPRPATGVVLAMLSAICVTLITNALDTSPTVSLIGAMLAAAVPALISTGGTQGAFLGVGLTAVAVGVTYVGFTAFDTATDRPTTFPVPAKMQQQPAHIVPAGNIELPDVVGSVYADAEAKLKAAGVSVTRQDVESAEQPETVVAQDPVAGTIVNAASTTVTLSVSNTRVVVPDVVQQDAETAQATLEELGLIVEVSPQEVADPSQDGVVLQQSLAGEAQAGATITLTVGTLPTITVPTTTGP